MLYKLLLNEQFSKLKALEEKRDNTACIIEAEQAALKQEAKRAIGTAEGLLFVLAAGFAASLTMRQGAKAFRLRHLPLSQVLALVSLVAQLKNVE